MVLFEQIQKNFKGINGYTEYNIEFNQEYGDNNDNIHSFIKFIDIDSDYLEGYTCSESASGCYTNEFRMELSKFLEKNENSYEDLVDELIKIKNGYERYQNE